MTETGREVPERTRVSRNRVKWGENVRSPAQNQRIHERQSVRIYEHRCCRRHSTRCCRQRLSTPDAGTEYRQVTHRIYELNSKLTRSVCAVEGVEFGRGTQLRNFVLGTVFLTTILARDGGWLVILAETAILFASIATKFDRASFP